MKQTITYLFLILLVIVLCQCKAKQVTYDSPPAHTVPLTNDFQTLLLDSMQAAEAIATDNVDDFFERVTLTEVSIQMKDPALCKEREGCIDAYKAFLRTDVASFTAEEVDKVSSVFSSLNELIKKVNPHLIDRDILLIKTKGNHYGNGVFYTRENKIIIPQDMLTNFMRESFLETMLHEFFHIFSRYNVETRNELYALIGFKPVDGQINLGATGSRKLLNPDGTTDYFIELEEGPAYPMITASDDQYIRSKPTFFNYLEFNLYQLEEKTDGNYELGEVVPLQTANSFFQQIKDNTNYIIHPDEIMADNFIYTIFYLAENEKIKDFTAEGMELINEMGEVLKSHR
ncbi:hypothetical protein [Portibacter marinus]|uniref:hypothetical protein n=1 Tax=Portibacter marinus TaxID=2898660 RepID=UPI001F2E33CA|nr:hypothetical protein [Portibacter marinus]